MPEQWRFTSVTHDQLRRALAEAEYRGWLDLDVLRGQLGRGRSGTSRLRKAMAHHEPRLARSEFERRMLALCTRAKLPLPECNAWIEGLLVDALWRAQRVVVEVDGRDGHRSWAQAVNDRRRDLTLRTAGLAVLRHVWDQLEHEPALVEADLTRALDLA